MKIEQLCQTLKAYLSQFSTVRILLPLSSVLLYVCGGLRVLNVFVSLGSVVLALLFFIGLAAAVLTLAECQFLSLTIGLGLYAVSYALSFILSLVRAHYLAYGTLIYLLVYGLLAYLTYRKSLSLR